MSMTNAAETAFLLLLFNNVDWTDIGDAGGLQNSVADGVFYVSLHTGDPGETGDQTTSECAYTSYARVSVVRTSSGWTIAGNNCSNTAAVNWPAATGGSETATYFGIGTDSSGAGNLIGSGVLSAGLAISSGITPTAAIGELDVTMD